MLFLKQIIKNCLTGLNLDLKNTVPNSNLDFFEKKKLYFD